MSQPNLLKAAREAQAFAYAPYSDYPVGAAILDASGQVWTGCNIENKSFGATLCAERVAIGKMASAGQHEIRAVAVVTADGGAPCGICLQTLLEFSPNPDSVTVTVADNAGRERSYTLAALIPHGFRSDKVGRTNPAG